MFTDLVASVGDDRLVASDIVISHVKACVDAAKLGPQANKRAEWQEALTLQAVLARSLRRPVQSRAERKSIASGMPYTGERPAFANLSRSFRVARDAKSSAGTQVPPPALERDEETCFRSRRARRFADLGHALAQAARDKDWC
jgi:hypothetical protein